MLATDDFSVAWTKQYLLARVDGQGSGFNRWGVREAVQVESVRSTLVATIATELSSSLTRQRTRELLYRRLRCLSGLKTWFVGPPDATV